MAATEARTALIAAPASAPACVHPSDSRPDRRGYVLRRLLLGADVGALAVGFLVAVALGPDSAMPSGSKLLLLVGGIPLWVVLAHVHGLYHVDSRRADYSAADEVGPIIQMTTLWSWGVLAVSGLTELPDVPVATALVFWAATVALVSGFRMTTRAWARRRPWFAQGAVVVGTGDQLVEMARRIARHPEYGIEVLACVDLSLESALDLIDGRPVLPADTDVVRLVRELGADRVLLAWSARHAEERLELVRELSDRVHVDLLPSWFELLGTPMQLFEMEGMPLLTVPHASLSRSAVVLKRSLDVTVSAAGLLLLLPVMLACSVAIALESGGPVVFRQTRVGREGRRFDLVKFRSMRHGAEADKGGLGSLNYHGGGTEEGMFKIRRDPRVTRVGSVLRRCSLDETPQLVNVLRGHMSLVGPRPLIESEDCQVEGRFRRRLSLTPGLTGLWQVNGRSEIPFDRMISLDYLYVTSWSLWGDLKILMKTVSTVVHGRGAY